MEQKHKKNTKQKQVTNNSDKNSRKPTKDETKNAEKWSILSSKSLILALAVSAVFGYFHTSHLETLFENDKHFSHLSEVERELSFRTESALYYYYFKILVSIDPTKSPPFMQTIHENVINDNRTEHPNTINALQRFNLYPEVFLACLYRFMNSLRLLSRQCWHINRGNGLSPIESCVGFGEPIYFYANSVFILHGFSMAVMFMFCWYVSDKNLLGGIVGCLCYFYNHGEATRVMWVPALRESFSFPFHLLQLFLFTRSIKSNCSSLVVLVLVTLVYLLPWQFAQFSLGTQAASLYAVYSLGFMSKDKLRKLITAQTIALVLCFVLMFANRMLLASFFSSILCSIWLLIAAETLICRFVQVKVNLLLRIVLLFTRAICLLLFAFLIKKTILPLLFQIEDDSHIWDILMSKFFNSHHTFDTRLYTCAKEFDFIETETFYKLTGTLVLPVAIVVTLYCIALVLKSYFGVYGEAEKAENGDIVYLHVQLAAFTAMAVLIMRLKLFWTPHLCVIAALVAGKRCSPVEAISKMLSKDGYMQTIMKYSLIIGLIGVMSYKGMDNINQQYEIVGEYSDVPMEQLMSWINTKTKVDDAFAGSMPTLANVKLSTNRPIMNHPHYEDVDLRTRTRMLYTHLFGYKKIKQLNSLLKSQYKVNYLIVESHYCMSHPPNRPECSMANVVHLNSPKESTSRVCESLINQNPEINVYFKMVFKSSHLHVFKVL